MRELLIRYLLGELEAEEQQRLEQRLRNSPELRRELAHLRTCFAAARDRGSPSEDLPRGLAERTTQRIAGSASAAEPRGEAALPQLSEAIISDSPPAGALGWSLADLTVAGGVFLAVSMLLFPALRDSRDATRATICQDHQRQLWDLFAAFAQDHGGSFPSIRPDENAGMFVIKLAEKGYGTPDQLAVLLVCPGAPLADQFRAGESAVQIPTRAQLVAMSPSERAEARRNMSPFYAYQFPYRIGNQYFYRSDDRNSLSPVLSDTSDSEPGQLTSPNHRGVLQVLFRDGSVRLFQSCLVPAFDDDLYRNAQGVVAAGCSHRDAVLGRSEAMPGIEFARQSR
jgi:hypothetical protein